MLSPLRQRLVRFFLTGVFAILPLVITVAIVAWIAQIVHRYVGPQTVIGQTLSSIGVTVAQQDKPGLFSYSIGITLALAAVFALGVLLDLGAKRMVHNVLDNTVNRIPAINKVYGVAKQLVDMLDRSGQADLKSMSPVFCEFGEKDPTGVLALLVSPEKFEVAGNYYHIVIVPTAPVPFGGGLLFVPVQRVKPAEVSADGLLSIYISLGATAPKYLHTTKTTDYDNPDRPMIKSSAE